MGVKKTSANYRDYKMLQIQKIQEENNKLSSIRDKFDRQFYLDAFNAYRSGRQEKITRVYNKYGWDMTQYIPYEKKHDGLLAPYRRGKLKLEELKASILKKFTQEIQSSKSKIEYLEAELSKNERISEHTPYCLGSYWLYQNQGFDVSGAFSDEEKKLLILEFIDKERRKFERLKNKFTDGENKKLEYERKRIPEAVRINVWRRDQGKCARCGSRENLEYDHIVPVSKGGSNTERNIELLCQNCNRSKGNRIE